MIWASVLMFLMQAIQLIFPATFYINYIQLRMMHDTTSQLEALNKYSVSNTLPCLYITGMISGTHSCSSLTFQLFNYNIYKHLNMGMIMQIRKYQRN